jgi:hypothetical protein
MAVARRSGMVIGMVVPVEVEEHLPPDGDRRSERGLMKPGTKWVDCISVILF